MVELLAKAAQNMSAPWVLGALGILLLYLIVMFLIAHIKKDTSIGNFTWGGGVMLLTLYTFFVLSFQGARQVLVTILIVAWCVRLATYVYLRYKKGADPRYVEWEIKKGHWATLFAFGWIVGLNGLMTLVMSCPSVWINVSPLVKVGWFDYVCLLVWIIGFAFETVSDYQLYVFRKNPSNKGHVLSSGLWRYSRHPNYFGEIVMWWAVFGLALAVPYGYLTIIAPITVTVLLVFVTGIPWLEASMATNFEYQEYKKLTSMLIPWWPRK